LTLELLVVAACAPLLLAYVVACFRDPLRWALPPYAVLIPFSSLLAVAPGPFGSVSSLLGLLLGVALVAQLVTTRRGSRMIPAEVPVWLVFLALCGLSISWSIAPRATIQSFAVLASLILLFVALTLTRFERDSFRLFETALVLGGVLVVCYGLAQLVFLGGLPAPDGRAARFGNDLLGANNQAAALLLPIAIAAGRSLTGTTRWRLVHAAATLLLLFGVIMTGSRGGVLSTLVVLGAVLILSSARRVTVIMLAAAAAVLLAVVIVVRPGGVGERQLQETDSSGRSDIWAVGLQACRVYCLTGTGWGGFPAAYALEQAKVPEAEVLERGTAFEPHNILLLAVVEAGVLGLILVLVGLGIALLSAWRLPPSMRGPPVAALLGTLVSSFFLSNLGFKFFWAVLAYVAISGIMAATRRAQDPLEAEPDGARFMAAAQDVR
jgi:O-antigen ligase